MGDYSQYCNVSKITINPNQKCVIIPLQKGDRDNSYLPVMLPIFGTYTGYGSLEDIEISENTKLIETHYADKLVSSKIDEIVNDIMRMDYEYNTEHTHKLFDNGIIGYMLVDRQVYDSLSIINHCPEYNDLVLGESGLLLELGFTLNQDETENRKTNNERYYQVWELNDKKIVSDETWIHLYDSDEGLYSLEDLFNHFDISDDKKYLLSKNSSQVWQLYKRKSLLDGNLLWVIGKNKFYSDNMYDELLDRLEDTTKKQRLEKHLSELLIIDSDDEFLTYRIESIKTRIFDLDSLTTEYCKNLNIFGDSIAELCTLFFNMRCFSNLFELQKPCVTPQYGQYKAHSTLLRLFADINDSYINLDNDEQ